MRIKKLVYSELDSNWDIFESNGGALLAIAKVDGASDSAFGNKRHVVSLMNEGAFNFKKVYFSDYGLEFFSGLHTVLMRDASGNIDIEKTRQEPKWYRI